MLQQPLVADLVEASPDVAFEYPLGGTLLGEHDETLFQGIGTPAAFAEAVGISVGQSFGYGCECQRVEGLHGAVVQGGDAQGSQFAVGLGDIMSAEGLGSVSVTFEVEGSVEFLLIASPDDVIYAGRFSASVRCYFMHGQELGRVRVSQDPLQGLHLAVLSCLCCLGN